MKERLFEFDLDTIEKVEYGADTKYIDVTTLFINQLNQNKQITISNEEFTDPCYNVRKNLKVTLKNSSVYTYDEGETLVTFLDTNKEKMFAIRDQIKIQEEYFTELKLRYVSSLIHKYDLHRIVEIGVHRGAFLLPITAYCNSEITCYGIDPYVEYQQEDNDLIIKYGTTTLYETKQEELNTIYDGVIALIKSNNLNCIILKRRFEETLGDFGNGGIDLLHVDGSYCYTDVKSALESYFEKIRIGGYLLCNGTNRQSVYKAYSEFIRGRKEKISVVRKTWEWICIRRVG